MKKADSKVDIGISQKNREEVSKKLNLILSNEYLLYTKALKFHWNVKGHQFHDFHEFFKDIYEGLLQISDDVAERVRTLGFNSFGTMTEFLKHSTLKEKAGVYPVALEMIRELLNDHEIVIKQLREGQKFARDHQDAATDNFLTEILMKQEKVAWMLRSHLER